MVARRLGLRVVLLERGRHPRFAIGESASPLAGILLETLADTYGLALLRSLAAHGPWQRAHPEIGCGLKRGFTFFAHETGRPYRAAADRSNQLLVEASPDDEVADTHWLRSDVDHRLVREATALGVEYLDAVRLEGVDWPPAGGAVLRGSRQGRALSVRARLVVDASGPRGVLSQALGLEGAPAAARPGRQAIFSHFEGVARCGDMPEYDAGGSPPYAVDDAALHHVFDGGWIWVLRFGSGLVSAGAAVEDRLARDLAFHEGAPGWGRLLDRLPSVAAQFANARPVRAFAVVPRLTFRATAAAGDRWALLPSAAAFADPMFSAGIPLTLLGIERLAEALAAWVAAGGATGHEPPAGWLDAYGRATLAEADQTDAFLAGCYASFRRFPVLAAYSMFYFATASHGELARRLSGTRRCGFLGVADARLSAALAALSPAAPGPAAGDHAAYARAVAAAVEPWNVAGLCDPAKRNWYAVDDEDTIRAAGRLGLTAGQARERLARHRGQEAGGSARPPVQAPRVAPVE
jgi:FADH2 O2-dependent halogenase